MKKNKITGKDYDVVESFNYAIEGVFEAIRSERHMKFHGFITIVAIIFSIFSGINRYEIKDLALAITLVWVAELFNSAIEAVVDMVTEEYHPLAKKAKDIAAGAVLVTGVNALVVGYLIFGNRVGILLSSGFYQLKGSFQDSVVFTTVVITMVVIVIKSYFKKGTPLRGGMPSGHSALGGGAFVAITFLTDNSKVFFLALILLVLVLQSRVEGKIHSTKEAILGALVGMGIMYVILQILGF